MIRPRAALVAAGWLALVPAAGAEEAQLADAVEAGDASRVEELIAAGAPLDAAQSDGMTALLWAVQRDDLAAAKQLLEAGANVAATNRYGVTPLPLACRNGNPAMVELLLANGANPNATLAGGETVLMTAARTGNSECVRALLAHGANLDARERRGQTALMWAAADGHAEAVKALLDAGADMHDVLPSGFTPLLFAVREGRREAVRALLEAGADPNAVVPSGKGGGGLRPGTGPLLLAIENAHFELALALVAAGADPNEQRSGFTPLHAVTWVRKTGVGDDEAGNPAPPGSGAVTSLEFVRRLADLGAEVNARLENGSGGRGRMHTKGATPFLFAARSNDLPLLKVLHELGADPSIPNIDGCTPLMAAAGIGTLAPGEEAGTEPEALETVAWLLDLGADLDAVDKNGETAMHGAAYKSLPKMVRFLDERGADIAIWNRKNKHGWTPLVIAQGFRPGNFKPAEETIAAISEVMRSRGLEPPPPPPRDDSPRDYEP